MCRRPPQSTRTDPLVPYTTLLRSRGIRQIRTDAAPVAVDTGNPAHFSVRELVMRGVLVNVMNPKGTVFLLAVVPQFVDTAHALTPQYAALAGTLVFTDLVAIERKSVVKGKSVVVSVEVGGSRCHKKKKTENK